MNKIGKFVENSIFYSCRDKFISLPLINLNQIYHVIVLSSYTMDIFWFNTDINHKQKNIQLFLAILLFLFLTLIPIEFYIMGEGYGYGIKGICYKYQISYLGDSFIPLSYELSYVISGTLSGKTTYAIMAWILGSILFGSATMAYWFYLLSPLPLLRIVSTGGIMGGSFLFLVSDMIQYGPFFSGPAGIALPFAIPLVLLLGWLVYRVQNFEDEW